jgi:vacuolar-type H+-ATPase subunit E/Vma4
MKPLGSVAAVVAAIREDAAVEVEGIARQADADIARLRANDAADPPTFADGEAQAAAARAAARARLAQEDWLDSRAAIDEREAWLARAMALGQQRLGVDADPDIQKQQLARLVHEAVGRLQSTAIDIAVSAADVALVDDGWREQCRTAHRLESLTVTAGAIDGGCLVRTRDGRASYDNSYRARADRFRSAWRAALADLYERSVQPLVQPAASDGPRT